MTLKTILKLIYEMILTTPAVIKAVGWVSTFVLFFQTLAVLFIPRLIERRGQKQTTLLTFTIYPDLARIWYHYARLNMDLSKVDIVIVDCLGSLNREYFPEAVIRRFWNFSHSTKIDHFLQYMIDSKFLWLSDDDVMIISREWERQAAEFFTDTPPAVISFAPRGWQIDQKPVMGSYSILFDRTLFIKEGLSFKPVRSDNQAINRKTGYYDTSDYASEQLILRGYTIKAIEKADQLNYTCGFVGTSMARVILNKGKGSYLETYKKLSTPVKSYQLVGAFCAWKVAQLYKQLFVESPAWLPPLDETDLFSLANDLPDDEKKKTFELFERYQKHYEYLLSVK